MFGPIVGKPGVLPSFLAQPRDLFAGKIEDVRFIPGPPTIDGTLSGNAANAPYTWQLWAGTVMGKVTATGKFANSIIGLTSGAYASGTTLSTDVNTAAELVRRVGGSGTFQVVGPPVASGVVGIETVTYSAVNTSTGAITITALGQNAVYTAAIAGAITGGSFAIRAIDYQGVRRQTAPIAWNSNTAGIQTALDAVFGAGQIVAGGTFLTAMTLTYSGSHYAGLPAAEEPTVDIDLLTGATSSSVTLTTLAAQVPFVSGSFIMPTDGSQNPLTLLCDRYGVQVIDQVFTTRVDIHEAQLLLSGGYVEPGYVVNYPTDPSLQAWLKSQLRSHLPDVTFRDDFLP